MEVDHLLLLHRELDDLVVVAGDGDRSGRPHDGDELRARRQLGGVGQRHEMTRDRFVGKRGGEIRFGGHRILELISAEIDLTEVESEMNPDRHNEKRKEATQPARTATVYHCDCAPSMTSFTMRSIACF